MLRLVVDENFAKLIKDGNKGMEHVFVRAELGIFSFHMFVFFVFV